MDLCRTLLFVPGNRQRMLDRAPRSGADIIVADLEDAVPAGEKREARRMVRALVAGAGESGARVFVRVNNVHTGLARGDLMEVVRAGLAGVVHPKTDHAQDLRDLDVLLREAELRNKVRPGDVAVVPLIETPRAILRCEEIARATDRVAALSLGGEDYTAELGVARSDEALAYARGVIVTVAAATGVPAIDTPYPAIDDERGLLRETRLASAMGFRGKYVIHPGQVGSVNAVFSPTVEDVAAARRIVEAARRAEKQRKGSVALDGRMIDAPIVERARRLLETAERIANGGA
ncbi:MAG TPA: CoA ester lyase [Dehalococcoidia bacterium]|nr:CoA ester lyase [Dehalococcoidia bacterium]